MKAREGIGRRGRGRGSGRGGRERARERERGRENGGSEVIRHQIEGDAIAKRGTAPLSSVLASASVIVPSDARFPNSTDFSYGRRNLLDTPRCLESSFEILDSTRPRLEFRSVFGSEPIGRSCPITGFERNRDETAASYAPRSKRPGKIVGVSRRDPFLGGEVTAWGVTRWAISRKRRSGFKGLARRGGQDRDFRGPLKDTFVCLCQNIGFH